jgi:D-inositol-3-phosphate glycosyltransferase
MPALAILSMHTSPLAQPGTADAGGMNVYVRELATAMARLGVRVEVYTRRSSHEEPEEAWVEPGFRIHHVAAGPVAPVPKEVLAELVQKWSANVAASLAELAARDQAVDVLHANYWLSAMAGHSLKHALDLPLVCSFHTLDRVKAGAGIEEGAGRANRVAEEMAAIACADTVLASCSAEANQLVAMYGADPARVEIVAPGVDRAFFGPGERLPARRAVGLETAAGVVLFVGRIQPLKALPVAVEAMAQLRGRSTRAGRSTLVVIGGPSGQMGPAELANVKALVRRHDLQERVRFVPPQPHELLSTYYRAADVCVVPSRSESFGLVALEAAACARPVVASAVGGLTTLVDHGRTGYLVEPDDISGFAHYLGEVLDDLSLARCLGSAAYERSASYTWAKAAQQMRRFSTALARRDLVDCGA